METNDLQFNTLKKMTPEQKLQASMRLYHSAKEVKTAWLRQLHADWYQDKIAQAVREIFANARS